MFTGPRMCYGFRPFTPGRLALSLAEEQPLPSRTGAVAIGIGRDSVVDPQWVPSLCAYRWLDYVGLGITALLNSSAIGL